MSKKEIEIHVYKDNKIDLHEFIEMKIKYDDEYFKKDKEIERLNNIIKEAIEYIKERYNGEVLTHTFDKCNVGELLNILKGVDKE